MTAKTFTIKGVEAENTTLPGNLFDQKVSDKLLAQAVRVYLSNQRKASAKTKTRGEVNRTTAKMYKQKGTGRARHGSYGAPVFVGGGIAHGPTGTQNYKMSMPVKMNQLSILGALSNKAQDKAVVVLSGVEKASGKTNEVKDLFGKLGNSKNTLVVIGNGQSGFAKAARNIDRISISQIGKLNAYEIIRSKLLIITPEAISELSKKYVA